VYAELKQPFKLTDETAENVTRPVVDADPVPEPTATEDGTILANPAREPQSAVCLERVICFPLNPYNHKLKYFLK
jgi:hypothetical protein